MGKKKYEKPVIRVERYIPNVAVSYCNDATTLYCLVAGQTHAVFSSGQDGCGNTSELTKIYIDSYTWGNDSISSGYYYIWYDGKFDNFTATYLGETVYTAYLKYVLEYGSGYHIAKAVTDLGVVGS